MPGPIVAVLGQVPWGKLLENAPTILAHARKLYGQSKIIEQSASSDAVESLQQEVSELRGELVEASKLIADWLRKTRR